MQSGTAATRPQFREGELRRRARPPARRIRAAPMTETTPVEYVLRTAEERGIRFVRLWFVDVLGLPKSSSIPVSELEQALREGVGVDGSALESGTRLMELDAIAMPDPTTFEVIPWRPGAGVARMFCDVVLPDGSPSPGDCRETLRRELRRVAQLGYTFQVGPEIEFFLFDGPLEDAPPRPTRRGLVLRPHAARRRERLPPPHDRVPRADGDRRQGLAPRGRSVAARARPEAHRRAVDGGRDHDLPADGEGGRARARPRRDVHAEADERAAGLRDAPAPLAPPRRQRPRRVLRPGPGAAALAARERVPRGRAPARARADRGHEPVG